jgi:hypothetical protein
MSKHINISKKQLIIKQCDLNKRLVLNEITKNKVTTPKINIKKVDQLSL